MSGSEDVTAPLLRARVRQDVTHHWKNLQLQRKKEKAALKAFQWREEDSAHRALHPLFMPRGRTCEVCLPDSPWGCVCRDSLNDSTRHI